MDPRSEAALALLYPPFAADVRVLCNAIYTQTGVKTEVIQGLRTAAEQDALFNKHNGTTNAHGLYSMHCFGLAADLCPSKLPGDVPWTPDWDGTDAHYAYMIKLGEKQGFNCGADWHSITDKPHFQLAGIPTTPTDEMRAVLAAHGLQGVWEAVAAGKFGIALSASAAPYSRSFTEDVTRVVLDDLANAGPISRAIEGWQG